MQSGLSTGVHTIFVMKYLLLTKCAVRTVSCGPSFFLPYGPSAKHAGHKKRGENEDP